ncbi:hypothetical protein PU629_03470 [Pullulanibacillus sp. KACC 23026]|uniref:hypothetical protein n=1 Tax=Pullulanibacillus sp. KACC 23026 TaxID=3028315 RepID=UPI0023AFCD69|nr:hypothetical protein [Pullulanibacillus sp. KACC 23026]WEG13441.1 hypothetical protein PU629_03470 [Pullulanibacillus sp. KACC 23026]
MKLNITNKQYKHLLDLIYLGEWTANSGRVDDDRIKVYDDLFNYFFSFANDFGYDDQVTYDKKLDAYFPTQEFEERLQPLIDFNDNEVFWNELPTRLAKRDIKQSGETFETTEDYLRKLFEIEGYYEDEFEENGLKNLRVQD